MVHIFLSNPFTHTRFPSPLYIPAKVNYAVKLSTFNIYDYIQYYTADDHCIIKLLLTYLLSYLLTYLLIDQFAKQVHCQVGQTVHAVTQKRGLFHLPVCYRPVIELSYRPGQTKRRTAPAVIPSNCSQYRGISICRKPVPASPLYCGCIPKLPKPAENRGDIPSTALGQNSGSGKTVRKEVGNAPLPSPSLSFLPSPPIPSLPHPSLPLPFPDAKQPPESQLGVWGALGRKRISVYFELENCTWRQHCDLRVLKFVYRRNVQTH